MYIVYVCILAPLLVNGFSLVGEETDLNSLSNYKAVDDNVDYDIWGDTNDKDSADFENISETRLEVLCKNSNKPVYISEEVTIDCETFNRGELPVEVVKNRIKRNAVDEVEGSGDELHSDPQSENTNKSQNVIPQPENNDNPVGNIDNPATSTTDANQKQNEPSEKENNETSFVSADNAVTQTERPVLENNEHVETQDENKVQEQKGSESENASETSFVNIENPTIQNENENQSQNVTSPTEDDNPVATDNNVAPTIDPNQNQNKSSETENTKTSLVSADNPATQSENKDQHQNETEVLENGENVEKQDENKVQEQDESSETENKDETSRINTENPAVQDGNEHHQHKLDETDNTEPNDQLTTEKENEPVKEFNEKNDAEILPGHEGKSLLPKKQENKGTDDQTIKSDESTQETKTSGSKDTMILVFLFVAVVVVGALAFGYNFIKKRKQQSADLEQVEKGSPTKNNADNVRVENAAEKQPLMDDRREVEMIDMKKNDSTENIENEPKDPTVKT